MEILFTARRRFDPGAGERWTRYVAWSGLVQLREVVSLDGMLCPTLPPALIVADWEHNVHADYQTSYFRSLEYLQARVAGEVDLNILAIVQNPMAPELASVHLPAFVFLGFDVLDVCGDISALTNCGGFDEVFAKAELSEVGLLRDLGRAEEVRRGLREGYHGISHTACDVWAVWRFRQASRAAA